MDTNAKAFVEKRAAAHAAGTLDIAKDPLVQAAMTARRDAAELMARWKERRQAPVDPTFKPNRRFRIRRQAG